MPIQTIARDWGVTPSIVRITTSDDLGAVLAEGYLESQASVIDAINNGPFTWATTDMVAIAYDGGKGIFDRSADGNLSFAAGSTQQTAVELTSAQVLGMFAAPVEIIPAPGADQEIRVHDVEIVFDWGTVQYAAGGAIALQYDDTVNGAGVLASEALAAATLNAYVADSTVGLAGVSTSGAATDKVGMGIFISNLTAAFTTGDSPITVHVWYSVINAGLV